MTDVEPWWKNTTFEAPCPYCHAQPGQWCRKTSNQFFTHNARKTAWTVLKNARLEAAAVLAEGARRIEERAQIEREHALNKRVKQEVSAALIERANQGLDRPDLRELERKVREQIEAEANLQTETPNKSLLGARVNIVRLRTGRPPGH